MPKAPKLRLFVWEGVLRDYTSGVAFALAYSADHARRLIVARDFTSVAQQARLLSGEVSIYDESLQPTIAHELYEEPRVYDEPWGFYLRGGG